MAVLTTRNLGKYFGGQDIFSGLNFSINQGDRIALVGPNGEGKTTLLQILAGLEPPSEGQIHTARDVKIGYLQQHASRVAGHGKLWEFAVGAFSELQQQEVELFDLEAALATTVDQAAHEKLLKKYGEAQARFEHAGGYNYEQTTRQVLTGLGFVPDEYGKSLSNFSGGEQSRIQLARLLLEQPNLLLLDEPTNHLDLSSVEWLENYLQQWSGAMLVVAHDRYFLDKVATGVYELSFGSIETYKGNFTHYSTQRQDRLDRRQKEYRSQQAFVTKEEAFIEKNLAGQRTREAQGRRKRLNRMERVARPVETKTLNLDLQTMLRSGDLVLATHDLTVGYPDDVSLFSCPDLEIRRGNRVALLGPNGSGKTTFVKTILNQMQPQTGEMRFGAGVRTGYFAQTHATLDPDASILDEILNVRNLPIGDARNYLGAFLFSGDDVFKPIGVLSGGERSRVALAKLTLTGANFLILDEPTNHLDIPSQENLERVLQQYQGTILLVSHDRYFVEALASQIWMLDPVKKSVTVIEGTYSDYLALRDAQSDRDNTNQKPTKSKGKRIHELTKAQKRAAEKKARQVADLERLIESTEAELAGLAQKLEEASRAQNVSLLQKLGQDYQTTEEKLEELLTQWTDMEPV